MLFNLNYGATIATLPISQSEIQVDHISFLVECPKSSGLAPQFIFDRFKTRIIKLYYEMQSPAASANLELIAVRGQNRDVENSLICEFDVYYYCDVFLTEFRSLVTFYRVLINISGILRKFLRFLEFRL